VSGFGYSVIQKTVVYRLSVSFLIICLFMVYLMLLTVAQSSVG
jgi:hypothetical protein